MYKSLQISSEAAIETFIKHPETDLILMDINLGSGMDGTEAAELILKEKNIPVVFLSSHTDPRIVEKTEGITSYGYVVKDSGIIYSIGDNGIGLPEGFNIEEVGSMGLKLVRALTEQINGSIIIKGGDGTRCMIEFPLVR